MGWLRDLMEQSDAGCRSYGDLARAALKSTDWPTESRMAERSLASIFSKLDRNLEGDWLAERVGVQRALSKVLGVPLDDLRAGTPSSPGSPRADLRRLRLSTLRYARALDLAAESLPPGVPEAVLLAGSYQNLLWQAPSGSGRSLVGHFLAARGLAQVLEADTFEQALTRLPERGPVFIELHSPRGTVLPRAPRSGLCVAGDFAPNADGWQLVRSLPVESYLAELVAWVGERLPADGRFDGPETEAWLRSELLDTGIVDGLGAALGLCGLADEFGLANLRRKPLRQIAERFCKERVLATLDPEAVHGAWLKRNAYEALVGLGRRVLADSEAAWDQARPLEAWLALVPFEHQREPDLDWMRLSLSQAESTIRPSDIDKAARRIPPGAFRIVRALQRADFLHDPTFRARDSQAPEAHLALGPRWFSNVLRHDALQALLSGSAADFGQALLRGHAAPSIARELVERLADRGGPFIESVLELQQGDSVGQAAALDMTFRAAGVALLRGADLPADTLEALWDEVIETRFELPGELPCPRIEYPDPDADALLSRGTWYLAALAVSAELGQRAGRRHPILRPWKAGSVSPLLRALCAEVARALPKDARDRPWVLRAFSLIARLRAEVGALGEIETPEVLERPAVILDEVLHGVLSWPTVAGVADDPLGLPALRALADERGVPFSEVARAIWEAWDDAHRPSDGAGFLAPDSAFLAWFWPNIPGELLEALLGDARATEIPYHMFQAEQWRAFLSALDTAPARADDARAFALSPDEVIEKALARGIESKALLASVWQRIPERALTEMARALDSGQNSAAARLSAILEAAPEAQLTRAYEALLHPNIANLGREQLAVVRRFLHDCVRARAPNYGQAYAQLSELERQLALAR